jgi:hypothetical protein
VETASERIEPPIGSPAAHSSNGLHPRTTSRIDLDLDRRAALRRARVSAELRRLRPVLLAYAGTWTLLILAALFDAVVRHHALASEFTNWDGHWYKQLAEHGYPRQDLPLRSTLGFFPLYPLAIWLVVHLLPLTPVAAGVMLSAIGGLVAAILVQRLATGWWGEDSGRRAAILFCLFPGAVVFGMLFSEGLLLPLAAGCILALVRRRWLLAGVLAGLATAVGADALALIPVCAMASLLALRRRGWRDPDARRSLLAPSLSLVGVSAFAAFLWAWTGTPFATLDAQRYGWGERTDPLALPHQLGRLTREISLSHFNHPTINLNLVVGLVGIVVLLGGIVLLLRQPRKVSLEAIVWTLGIAFLATTSEYVPPNPRLLITAFPVVVVFAHYVKGKRFVLLATLSGCLLLSMSVLTFVGTTLRP